MRTPAVASTTSDCLNHITMISFTDYQKHRRLNKPALVHETDLVSEKNREKVEFNFNITSKRRVLLRRTYFEVLLTKYIEKYTN